MPDLESMRKAIAVMTAWADDANSAGDVVASYVREGPDEDIKLAVGLISLAGWLLVRLEEATGKDMRWHLQDIARTSLNEQ